MTTAALQDMFYPQNHCFGCGPANRDGLHLKSYERDGAFTAEWIAETRYQGPPGIVNGGFLAVPMDCHSTWAAMYVFSQQRGGEPCGAVTAGYEMTLRVPTPVGERITFVAEVTEATDRKAKVRCTATVAGEVTAEFSGTWIAVDLWEGED